MQNGKRLGAVFLAFIAGYFLHSFFADNSLKTKSTPYEHSTASQSSASSQRQTVTINSWAPNKTSSAPVNASSVNSASSTIEQKSPKNASQMTQKIKV